MSDQVSCPKCQKPVYAMEEVGTGGKKWHKTCFRCETCSTRLNPSTACKSQDDNVFCRRCYKEGIYVTRVYTY